MVWTSGGWFNCSARTLYYYNIMNVPPKLQFAIILVSGAFAGCVNVEDSIFHTQYQKTNWYNAGGYDDRMIQSDLYQVWFAANQIVKKENVDYFALVRASEVTVLAGKEYFEVVSGQDVGKTILYASPGALVASVSSVSATATATAVYVPPSETSVTYPKTLLLIRLKNEKTGSAYNAKEVLLGAKQKGLKLKTKI
jgi:hypothetical protein